MNTSTPSQLLLDLGCLFVVRNEEDDTTKNSNNPDAEIFEQTTFSISKIDSEVDSISSKLKSVGLFSDYKFNHDELCIIAVAWYKYIKERECNIDSLELLKTVFGKSFEIISGLDIVIKLIKQNVFYTVKRIINHKQIKIVYNDDSPIEVAKYSLLENDICVHRSFSKLLLNEKLNEIMATREPYTDNKEYLSDWFSYVNMLYEFSSWGFHDRQLGAEMHELQANEYLKAFEYKAKIDTKMKLTDEVFPFIDLCDEYNLDDREQVILMYLVKCDMDGDNTDTDEVIKLISSNNHEMYQNREYLSAESKLVENGLVEITDNVFFRTSGSDIRVSPDVTRRIILKTPLNDDERMNQILKGNDIFTLLTPQQTFKDLILHSELKRTIQTGISQYNNNTDQILRDWGLFDLRMYLPSGYKKKIEPGLLMLFHGLPGTGKTFAAGAIANLLGKKLLITDISRIHSKWVGDSEKNVKRLFTTYEKVVRRASNPPILLLNEADQFLTRRLDVTDDAVDVMYNALQNLFLEAFEQLRGILIATTNLQSNLDQAFSRRFHLKLEFPLPGISERKALWRLHLPDTIPGAEKINISKLANEYQLTGGQIQIIVKNAATEAATRPTKGRLLLEVDIEKYCQLEVSSTFDSTRKSFGFIQPAVS